MALKSLKTDTLNTVGDVNGLVHIETQTISSGVSAVNFNNVFTTTYDTYFINGYTLHSSTNAGVDFRLRNAGSDRTANNYDYQAIEFFGTSNNNASTTFTIFPLSWSNNNAGGELTAYVYNPASSGVTGLFTHGGSANRQRILTGGYRVSETQDGFSVILGSGTWASGFISVYGLVK